LKFLGFDLRPNLLPIASCSHLDPIPIEPKPQRSMSRKMALSRGTVMTAGGFIHQTKKSHKSLA
jgi:hypothetical protein